MTAEERAAAELADAQERQQEFDDGLAWVLSAPQGRGFCRWLMEHGARLRVDPYAGDRDATHYNLGQRSVGRWLDEQIRRVDLDLYGQLLLEGVDELRRDRAHRVQGDGDSDD